MNRDKYGNIIYRLVIDDDNIVRVVTNPNDATTSSLQSQYGVYNVVDLNLNFPISITKEFCEKLGFIWDSFNNVCKKKTECYTFLDNNNEILFGLENRLNEQRQTVKEFTNKLSVITTPLNINLPVLQKLKNPKIIFGLDGNKPLYFQVDNLFDDQCHQRINQIETEISNLIAQNLAIIEIITNSSNNDKIELSYNIDYLMNQSVLNTERINKLQKELDYLKENCNLGEPSCYLIVSFDYLINYECDKILNCAQQYLGYNDRLIELYNECQNILNEINNLKEIINLSLQSLTQEIIIIAENINQLEVQLNNTTNSFDVAQINYQIQILNEKIDFYNHIYSDSYETYQKLSNEYEEQIIVCNRLNELILLTEQNPYLLDIFNNIKIYFTIEKQIETTNTEFLYTSPQFGWETVYRKEIFTVKDFISYIRNNNELTGFYLSGNNCQDLIQQIKYLLGPDCDLITDTTFNSDWIHFEIKLNDINFIKLIANSNITFGLEFEGLDKCNSCILLDNIKFRKICKKNIENSVLITKCPGFELEKVVDNKKSWVYTEKQHNRKYDGISRYTNYDINDSRAVLNSKELELCIDPSKSIELDVFNFFKNNSCVLQNFFPNEIFEIIINLLSVIDNNNYHNIITSLIDAKTIKSANDYPIINLLYNLYYNFEIYQDICEYVTNKYCYDDMFNFINKISNRWFELIEQIIPSTTIWGSSYKYRNSIFHAQKYKYCRYSLISCPKGTDMVKTLGSNIAINVPSGITLPDEFYPNNNDNNGNCYFNNVFYTDNHIELFVENLSNNINLKYPDCFINNIYSNKCNIISTLHYNYECEYIGRVSILGDNNSREMSNAIIIDEKI